MRLCEQSYWIKDDGNMRARSDTDSAVSDGKVLSAVLSCMHVHGMHVHGMHVHGMHVHGMHGTLTCMTQLTSCGVTEY